MLGQWARRFANDSELNAELYFDRTFLRDPFATSPYQPAGTLVDELDTYELDIQHRFWLGEREQIVWGGGYRVVQDDVKQQAPNFGFFPAQKTQRTCGVFAQNEIKVANDVYATIGSKLERNDYTGWEVEPNARLRRDMSSRQTLWTAVSRGVRIASRFDRDLAIPSIAPVLISGSKTFDSERLVSWEMGYRAEISRTLSGSISLFYSEYDDLRGLAPTPGTTLPLVYRNVLDAESYGAELSVAYQPMTGSTIKGGFTTLQSNVEVSPGEVDLEGALAQTQDPQPQFSIRSFTDLGRQVELGVIYRWVDTLHTGNFGTPGTVPAYSELDVRLGWHATNSLELSIVGQNLLHAQHPEYGFPSSGREELQRKVYGKAVWRF